MQIFDLVTCSIGGGEPFRKMTTFRVFVSPFYQMARGVRGVDSRVQLSFWMLAGESPVGIKVGQSRSQQPGYGVICALRRCMAW